MQKFGGVKFRKDGLKCKFGVNPQSFSHELCLYIKRFYYARSAFKCGWYLKAAIIWGVATIRRYT